MSTPTLRASPSPVSREQAEAWDKSGFFPRHKTALTSPLEWPNPHRIDSAYTAIVGGGAVALVGPRGTGKTQLAAHLAWKALRWWNRNPLYMRAQDYFTSIKRSFDGEENDPRRKVRNVGLLVLDEVQERYETAFEDLELTSLLDHRYGHERPTILIGNLTADALAQALGTSIVSRIQETGIVVPCDWKSFRDEQAP